MVRGPYLSRSRSISRSTRPASSSRRFSAVTAGSFHSGVLAVSYTHLDVYKRQDGEGASKLVTVNVHGAATKADADTAARSVANSPLVKTAIAGHDCNWGRIAAALGKCGVPFDQSRVDIDIMGMPVCRAGLTVPFDEAEALRRFEEPEIVIEANLGAGTCSTTCLLYTSPLACRTLTRQ